MAATAEAADVAEPSAHVDEQAAGERPAGVHLHIPESLAERLGDEEIRRAHSESVEPQLPSFDENADRADADDDIPPIVRRGQLAPSRRSPLRRAALAVALIAIGVAGYAVYDDRSPLRRDGDVAFVGKSSTEATQPEPPREESARDLTASPTPAEPVAAPAAPANAIPGAALPSAVQPDTPSVSKATEPVPSQPGAMKAEAETVRSQPETVRSQPETVRSQPETVRSRREEPAGRTRKPPDAAAAATQRLIARDLGLAAASADGRAQVPVDRDAIETQRLIERDLGPFLRDKQNGTSRDALPAIN